KLFIINVCLIMLCNNQYSFSTEAYTDRYALDKKFDYFTLNHNNGEECVIKLKNDNKTPRKITVTIEDNISNYNIRIAPLHKINIPKINHYKLLANKLKNNIQDSLNKESEEQDSKKQSSEIDFFSKFRIEQMIKQSNEDVNTRNSHDSFSEFYEDINKTQNNIIYDNKNDFFKDNKDNLKKINITTDIYKGFRLNKDNKKHNKIGMNIRLNKKRSRNNDDKNEILNNRTYNCINTNTIFNNNNTNKKYIVEFNNVKKQPMKNNNNISNYINNNVTKKHINNKTNNKNSNNIKTKSKPLNIKFLLKDKSNKKTQNLKDTATLLKQIQQEYNFDDSIKAKILKLDTIYNKYKNKYK
ncbi:MAG: hypothetical protein IJU54_02810, partial [Alphaproteobacteria bacterium]|nr:hypothetical protein [Alphaproteobacteria bacterium]